jgi:predicted dehydrogenase
MTQFRNGIVIGCGSIGKKHAQYLSKICDNLILVDPIFNKTSSTIKVSSVNSYTHTSINEVKINFNEEDIAVVSNWGPDHFKSIKEIVVKGIKKIVLEKPCVDSLEEIDQLRSFALKNQLQISVNQGWFYENLAPKILKISTEMNLGKIVAIWITGGARCLSTAGSHWVSLANQIYESNPIYLVSDASNHHINPRSSKLAYLDGVFSFAYSENRRLGINLSNFSSIEGRFEIYWRDAIGELSSEDLKIFARSKSVNLEKITLYGQASELIFHETVIDINNQFKGLYKSFTNLIASQFLSIFDQHLDVNRAILLSLIASEQKKKINFREKIQENLYHKKYGIS